MMIPFDEFGGHGQLAHLAHANSYPPGAYAQLGRSLSRQYHVIASHARPLWPGTKPEEMESWHQVAADLLRFFNQQGIEQLVGIGHSLGGVATLYAAERQPHLFRAIVLIEPVFFAPEILEVLERSQTARLRNPMVDIALRRRNSWPDREAAFVHFRAKPVYQRLSDSALMDYVNSGTTKENNSVTLTYPREWEARIYQLTPLDIWSVLPRVQLPTLAVRAAESNTLLPDAWRMWQQVQPHATFVEIADSDHLLPLSHPEPLAATILAFLNDLV